MARNNPSNPFTQDPQHTQKDIPMPVSKARVLDAGSHPEDSAFHTVTIQVYGDQSPYIAPVLTPMFGSVWIPKENTDVAVIFGANDKPWVIGAWYPLDRVQNGEVDLPDYEPGDIRLGNETGAHVEMQNDGAISMKTGELSDPIDIDFQVADVSMSTDQNLPPDTYTKIEFDQLDNQIDHGLFDPTANEMTILADGYHKIRASIGITDPGQGVKYELAIFVNGVEEKRFTKQSANNIEMSIPVHTNTSLDEGDVIDIRLRQDSNQDKIVESDSVVSEFHIDRKGI